MTAHRHRFIFARSISSDKPEEVLSGHYDLALVAPSWDHRCESITAAVGISIGTCILLRFSTRDAFGFQLKHEEAITSFLKSRCQEVSVIQGDAVQLSEVWSLLWKNTTEIIKSSKQPLRVLVDLSTCPRYYSLGFIAGILRFGYAHTATVFYAEGVYKSGSKAALIDDYPFTIGHWNATAIPFLAGSPDALKQKAYVVSVGFEGLKTARVLAREDPDRVSVLFPDPGSQPEYVSATWSRNKEIIDQYRIPTNQIIRAAAGDAVAAWKSLSIAKLERFETDSLYYLCSGSKPHALGLTLRAICTDYPTVMYNLPERHSFVEVEPTGVFWAYEINDLSTPTHYEMTGD